MITRSMIVIGIAAAITQTGCVRRTISITSDPSGALVSLNGREVGRTPCEAEFTYYGTYDVRLALSGYSTIEGGGQADAPWWDFIGADLVSEVIPQQLESRTEWHFDMKPADGDVAGLLVRARELRDTLTSAGGVGQPQAVRGPLAPEVAPNSTMERAARRAGVPVPPTFVQP
ncbi:MAG: PEGA domain-containing protein [Phycisphaerales bacterium]|nr:PEGA domain-containing protein [Phycisphaerales bacterium]